MGNQRGGASATWERDLKMVFIDIYLKEIELDNRSITSFNNED